MVLVGDSHMRQWIPALELIAKQQGYLAYFLVREGCPAIDQTPWDVLDNEPGSGCQTFQDWAAGQVKELRPDITFLASMPMRVDSPTSTATAFRTTTWWPGSWRRG